MISTILLIALGTIAILKPEVSGHQLTKVDFVLLIVSCSIVISWKIGVVRSIVQANQGLLLKQEKLAKGMKRTNAVIKTIDQQNESIEFYHRARSGDLGDKQ